MTVGRVLLEHHAPGESAGRFRARSTPRPRHLAAQGIYGGGRGPFGWDVVVHTALRNCTRDEGRSFLRQDKSRKGERENVI
jgi:hypothetical protein